METKEYTIDQEQLARFAKAQMHPARIAQLSGPTELLFFR